MRKYQNVTWGPTAACLAVMMGLVAVIGCGEEESRRDSAAQPTAPTVTIGNTTFAAEIAQTPAGRALGLSGRHGLSPQTGMLFVFETENTPALWMRGMLFPLDLIWIGEDCTVVDVTLDVASPAPDTPDSKLPLYEPREPAAYAMEINAGEAERFGIAMGDEVRFSTASVKGAEC